ncbi:MAG: toprim domain-containing protein [Thermaceae bacterium]|nr:toprim domain-containing protein [Thermaceae bacterium]
MNALSQWRSEIKTKIDLRQWAAGLPGYRKGNPAKILCPFHQEKTPSLAVYADHAFCFGSCQKSFDVFDLLEQTQGLSKQAALEEAAVIAGIPLPQTHNQARAKPTPHSTPQTSINLELLVSLASTELHSGTSSIAETGRQYLLERNLATVSKSLALGVISEEVAQQAGMNHYLIRKFKNRLLIPYRYGERVYTFTARSLTDQEPKYDRPSGEIQVPFNAQAIDLASQQSCLLLTEGELDAGAALVALGSQSPVMGLPGGKLPKGWLDKLRGITCYLAMDNDNAGQHHAQRLSEELTAAGIKVRILEWVGEGVKDLNQMLVEQGSEVLASWLENRMAEAEIPSDFRYVGEQFARELDARANRPINSYDTSLPTFDRLLEGGFSEGLHVLGGVTASGKTLLALQVAIHNASRQRPVIFVSYEQSKFELWSRVTARLTGLPISAFKRGVYAQGQTLHPLKDYLHQHYAEQLEHLKELSRYFRVAEGDAGIIEGAGRWSVATIKAEAERQADAYGLAPLVVLDYLQRMPAPAGSERRELRERVAMVASSLQVELARGLGCPVLAISSVNRASYGAGRNRLENEDILSMFKESGEVEYSAYTASMLYKLTDKEAVLQNHASNPLSGNFDPFVLHLAKHREGRPGRILLRRYGSRGIFEDRGEAKNLEEL